MFGIHDFGLFLAAGILLNLTPGPDTVYILGRSVAQGRETGIASALGICLGSIFHTCAAALGLSAILATSALAFGAIKLLGGAYLIFLGIKMVLDRRKHLILPSNFRRRTIAAAFRQGVLKDILNLVAKCSVEPHPRLCYGPRRDEPTLSGRPCAKRSAIVIKIMPIWSWLISEAYFNVRGFGIQIKLFG